MGMIMLRDPRKKRLNKKQKIQMLRNLGIKNKLSNELKYQILHSDPALWALFRGIFNINSLDCLNEGSFTSKKINRAKQLLHDTNTIDKRIRYLNVIKRQGW